MAKYAGKSATPESSGMSSAVPPLTPSLSIADPPSQQPSIPASPVTKAPDGEQKGGESVTECDWPVLDVAMFTVKGESATPEPELFDLAKEEEAGQAQTVVQHQNEADGAAEQSAADYDPSMDRREDEHKRLRNDQDVHMVADDAEEEYEEVEEVEEDLDDMFAIDDEKPKKVKKKVKVSPK
jgi:serine/threonine-protein kinase PRP4